MKDCTEKCLMILDSLHKRFPSVSIGRHLSMALEDANMWALTDKALLSLLEEYNERLTLQGDIKEDVDAIVNDALHLDSILDDEDD